MLLLHWSELPPLGVAVALAVALAVGLAVAVAVAVEVAVLVAVDVPCEFFANAELEPPSSPVASKATNTITAVCAAARARTRGTLPQDLMFPPIPGLVPLSAPTQIRGHASQL